MGIYQCCIRSLYPERSRHNSHDYISNHWTAIELCFPQITICRHCCVWKLLTLWHGNASRITDHLSGDTTESVMGSLRVFSVVSLNKWFADYLRRHGAPVMSLHLTVCMNVKFNADIYDSYVTWSLDLDELNHTAANRCLICLILIKNTRNNKKFFVNWVIEKKFCLKLNQNTTNLIQQNESENVAILSRPQHDKVQSLSTIIHKMSPSSPAALWNRTE